MVKVGDEIAEGDVVAEVMTDKVDMEVESTVAGTLVEIVHETGTVEVGEPIGWVEGEDDGGGFGDLLTEPAARAGRARARRRTRARAGAALPPAPPAPEPAAPTSEGPSAAVPRARGLANERGIDLTDGRRHRPGRPDPRLGRRGPGARRRLSGPGGPGRAGTGRDGHPGEPDRKTAIRAAVARKMTPSAEIPQFTVWREMQLDAANAAAAACPGPPCCCARTPRRCATYPTCCAAGRTTGPPTSGPPAVALAVATDRGLLVPTFDEPDLGDPHALDAEIRDVVRSAHTGKLDRQVHGRGQRVAVEPRRHGRGPVPGAADAAAGQRAVAWARSSSGRWPSRAASGWRSPCTPASPSTTASPTARTPRSCSQSFANRLGGSL